MNHLSVQWTHIGVANPHSQSVLPIYVISILLHCLRAYAEVTLFYLITTQAF